MKEFVYGTDAQYEMLDQALSEGKKYRYADRQLPDACEPNTACLWMGKINGVYRVYIDKGIATSTENMDFKRFLSRGEAVFANMDDLKEFFYSLRPLFPAEIAEQPNPEDDFANELTSCEDMCVADTALEHQDGFGVVDMKRLNEIRAEREKVRTVLPQELASRLKQKVFGQDEVIDSLCELVVINQMRKDEKLLVVTLLGPTATGKSETAKSLAEVMSDVYHRMYGNIEINGNEFIGEHTVHRFFGAPPGYVGHGEKTILEPVRKNPYHVIVINEIEKADTRILEGLMEAIDTGKLGMADNSKPIDLNQCILLFTSNIPIDVDKYEAASTFERTEMCRDAFTKHCGRPEISGKIGNFLVFRPLNDNAITNIVIKFIREELETYDLTLAHVDEYLMDDFIQQRTKYGARGIRDLVNEAVGRHLLRNRGMASLRGKKVSLSGRLDNIRFEEWEEGHE